MKAKETELAKLYEMKASINKRLNTKIEDNKLRLAEYEFIIEHVRCFQRICVMPNGLWEYNKKTHSLRRL